MLRVNYEKCNLCGRCMEVCPFGGIGIMADRVIINEKCRLCRQCIKHCPTGALSLSKSSEGLVNHAEWQGVLVFAEQSGGVIHPVTYELIGKGRELAKKLGQPLNCVLIGYQVRGKAAELLKYGVEKVYVYDYPELECYSIEPFRAAIAAAIEETQPNILLIGATSIGRSLAPRLAVRFRTGLTADCTVLDVKENGDLIQIRPAFGGNIMAQIVTPHHRPQMATVRYKVMEPAKADSCSKGEVVSCFIDQSKLASRVTVLQATPKPEEASITDAEVIVAVGRGIRTEGDLNLALELAHLLGGQLGATRPLIECGWLPYTRQIGLSGRTVRPKLLIACGISGAVQFVAGMSNAEQIYAINSDPNAPIFNVATHAIIGDLYQIIPRLIQLIKGEGIRVLEEAN